MAIPIDQGQSRQSISGRWWQLEGYLAGPTRGRGLASYHVGASVEGSRGLREWGAYPEAGLQPLPGAVSEA
eukprot:3203657-Rhodomonas_salina.2